MNQNVVSSLQDISGGHSTYLYLNPDNVAQVIIVLQIKADIT